MHTGTQIKPSPFGFPNQSLNNFAKFARPEFAIVQIFCAGHRKFHPMMPPKSSPVQKILTVGIVTLILYIAIFSWMENRRRKNGPWEITFTQTDNSPALFLNHAKLGLTNITILFPGGAAPTHAPQTIRFEHGRVAPFELPFGKCIFLDTLFLPGTVTCEVFGHEIQMLPRTLTIDREEHAWRSGEKFLLTNRPPATLQAL